MSDDYTEVIAPGAFAANVGREVPLTVGGDHKRIGTATVDADGLMTLTFDDPEMARLVASWGLL